MIRLSEIESRTLPYSVFAKNSNVDCAAPTTLLNEHYTFVLWRPGAGNIVPRGISPVPFIVWWLFHYLHLFRNRDYALFVVYDRDKLIHRSGIFPGYFRFPFMSEEDLQIGDTWTEPSYRGQGLATFAIQEITDAFVKPGRRFWYVTRKDNLASIAAVQKAGFIQFGEGIRTKRLGMSLLGSYVLQ